MSRINLDFETRSRVDLKKCGAFRYADDDSTDILIVALSANGGPRVSWDLRQPVDGSPALQVLRTAIEEGWEIHAWNAPFEFAVLVYVATRQFGFPAPKPEQMRCSAAMARTAGCPSKLAKAGEFLRLPKQKDTLGDALIQKFCVPEKDGSFRQPDDPRVFTAGGMKMDGPAAFQRFVDYCIRDVEVEMDIANRLSKFALKGDVLDSFLMDMRMNARGLPVDVEALKHAHTLMGQHAGRLTAQFRELTGFNPAQNARVKEWLQERGYKGSSLDAESREKHANDEGMDDKAKEALRLVGELAFAALKKIPALLKWVQRDDHVRGAFIWCGAQKTWRWSSVGPQFQNMKKPPKWFRKFVEGAFDCLKQKVDLETFEQFYGNPYATLAFLSRYFVRFPDDNLFDIDFSQVEARILPELIECQRILDKFRRGEDIYMSVAEKLDVSRDMGKVLSLLCQFQGGWRAVLPSLSKGSKSSDARNVVKVYREENPEVVTAWKLFQDSFVKALDTPAEWVKATKHVSFGFTKSAPYPRVLMRLPSGRSIVYPYPEKKQITMALSKDKAKALEGEEPDENDKGEWLRLEGHWTTEEINERDIRPRGRSKPVDAIKSFHAWDLSFWGHIEGAKYGRVNTYGGDLLQSATQATGVDLLTYGCLQAEKEGFDPLLVVHDQAIYKALGDKELLTEAMCRVPEWFEGFPLEATLDVTRSYSKQ